LPLETTSVPLTYRSGQTNLTGPAGSAFGAFWPPGVRAGAPSPLRFLT